MAPCLLLALSLVALPEGSAAEPRRVALLAAHPFGGGELVPLRYTARDLERMREVLQSVGEVEPDDLLVSFAEDADELVGRFRDARERVLAHARGGHPTLFLFYYSGHAKDGELRLGDSRLELAELKALVDSTGAAVRLTLVDSCRAGSITRLKGASKGEPLTTTLAEDALPSGQILITASSAYEDAQESDEIQGSFFTHFLTTGLRGAADDNGDDAVTLAEAYAFAYAGTVARTVGTRGGVQHPTYRFDLRGAGDLVLARTARRSALTFAASLGGHYLVFAPAARVVVAELFKEPGRPARIAVAPGDYVVKKRERDHLRLSRITVPAGGTTAVDESAMETVAFADDYAKGAVVTVEEVLYGRLRVALAASLGAQAFLSAPVRGDYFPTLGLLELDLDLDNALRRGLGVRFDLGLGRSGDTTLVLDDPDLGELRYRVAVSQLGLGIALTGTWPVHERVHLGAHTRLGLVTLRRSFAAGLPEQSFSTLTPGLGLEARFSLTRWLWAGVRGRVHYMFFNVDERLSLAFVDGSFFLAAVIR